MAESMSKAGKEQGELWHTAVSESMGTLKTNGISQKVPGTGPKGSHWLNLEQRKHQK